MTLAHRHRPRPSRLLLGASLLAVMLTASMTSISHAFAPSASAQPQSPQQAGEPAKAKQTAKKQRPNPALQPIEDQPGLPRVLLLGDSISIGYTVGVRELLKDTANVHRPAANCGPTTLGLKQLDRWLGDPAKKWDVIHFNWGLHDLKYMGPEGQNLADPQAEGAHQQVPPEEYERNLRALVERLQQTGAVLIWRTTTPVPQGARGRVVGDSKKYNEIAEKIMREHKIRIDDMYAYGLERLGKIQRPKDVHFTAEGNKFLSQRVAESIREALKVAKQTPRPE